MNASIIEIKLHSLDQLFNSMDPSPFHERDLDHDAEEFIVSWAQEYALKTPLILRVRLDKLSDGDNVDMVSQAIHNYFIYRTDIYRREFKYLMKQARIYLLIGLMFLGVCFLAGHMIMTYNANMWGGLLRESLMIVGWVAMWRPIQLYFYEWWPVKQKINIYKKLSEIRVEVVQS